MIYEQEVVEMTASERRGNNFNRVKDFCLTGTPVAAGGDAVRGRVEARREICSGSKAGSYLRRIDSFMTQLKAHSRTCNESKEEGVGRW